MAHTKEQKKANSQKVREERKAYALNYLGGKCVVCGTDKDLEFDHIDPSTKSKTMTLLWTSSWAKFETELKKCQLLCRPHHIDKTAKEQGWDRTIYKVECAQCLQPLLRQRRTLRGRNVFCSQICSHKFMVRVV